MRAVQDRDPLVQRVPAEVPGQGASSCSAFRPTTRSSS
ncbi:MAG: hypothetical protein M0C28_16515 [Candidatus Moduliflexus flocculans]|nr:hypothetical protein [Candidatus Moduliflexus flocculans]